MNELLDHIVKDLHKNTSILEIFCGYGSSYNKLKKLGYKNYIGIDDTVHKIVRCKSLFGKEDRNKFIYCENINEYILNNKFDVIFCIGPYKNVTMTSLMKSAKAKIFYCIQSNNTENVSKVNYISKIRDISKKLNCFPDFSWDIVDSLNKCQITGINYTSLSLVNNSYLIMRDLLTEIIYNMDDDYKSINDILSLFVNKYTCYNSEPVHMEAFNDEEELDDLMIFFENNDELHIVVPLVDNFVVDLDNDSFAKHVLDKGDIILVNNMDYITSNKCIQYTYKIN